MEYQRIEIICHSENELRTVLEWFDCLNNIHCGYEFSWRKSNDRPTDFVPTMQDGQEVTLIIDDCDCIGFVYGG